MGVAMIRFIFILIMLCLVGCKTKYVPVETKVTETVEYHDTTVTEKLVPYKESVAVKDTISFLSNPYAYSEARWNNGILHHTLGIYPEAVIIIKVPQYLDRTRIIENPQIIEVEKKLNKWQQLKVDYGGYAFIVICVAVVWLIYKNRTK